MTPYGHFSQDGSEFVITQADLPRNWYNYMFHDRYIGFTSQTAAGESFLQDDKGMRVTAVTGRGLYLFSKEAAWCVSGLPAEDPGEDFCCTHGQGYTRIDSSRHGIRTEYLMFIPDRFDEMTGMELHRLRLTNTTDHSHTLRAVCYTDNNLDGGYARQGYNTATAGKSDVFGGVFTRISRKWNGNKRQMIAFLMPCGALTGYDAAKNAFIGPYGSLAYPRALRRGYLTNTGCVGEKFGFAVETTVTLAPGATEEIVFLAGVAPDEGAALSHKTYFADPQHVEAELEKVRARHSAVRNGFHVETPDESLNHLLNFWTPFQTNMGSRWARVRHNGYRDMASDTECLGAFNPVLAWTRIKRVLSYQYSNGYAPRTFLDGVIKDNNFSDCTVWLTFAVHNILMELGDLSLLEDVVPFNDGREASVYEHLYRSVDFLYRFTGHHGLIRIWGGDWNDCMDLAGMQGKGVSIWLSIAWYRACRMFVELARLTGHADDAALFAGRAEQMKARIEEYGWDGEYYLYAINDQGRKIGSRENQEGSTYLNPQIWAVFADLSERAGVALTNAEQRLASRVGVRVSGPAYTAFDGGIGSMTLKSPGVQENGGVYLHAICWKLAADAMLGRADRVEEGIRTVLPWANPAVAGRAEPYTLCNCYFGEETGYRMGTPGQSWRTATAQWFTKAMIQYVFGLQATVEGLTVNPCLPPAWRSCAITKRFRGACYHIRYENGGTQVCSVLVDGQKWDKEVLPCESGRDYQVTVVTG